MAVTIPINVDSAIEEIWARETLRSYLRAGFWGRFVGGEGSGMPIVQKTELLNKPGDLIHIQVTAPLTGSGVSGDTATLEGNEESLSTSEIRVSPILYRHGVRVNRRANKKAILDLRAEAKMRLGEWGMDKMDSLRFSQFISSTAGDVSPDTVYTPNVYGVNSHVTTATIVAGDKLTVAELRKIRYKLLANKAQPFMVNGLPWFAIVISPEVEVDLKNDTTYQNFLLNAANRGIDSNPLFTGVIANVEGMLVYSDFRVPTGTNAGPVRYAQNLAFGKEFAVEAVDEDVSWVERDHFDYGHEWGVGYSFACKARRALELSSLQVLTSAVLPA